MLARDVVVEEDRKHLVDCIRKFIMRHQVNIPPAKYQNLIEWSTARYEAGSGDVNIFVDNCIRNVSGYVNIPIEQLEKEYMEIFEMARPGVLFTKKHYIKVGESIGKAVEALTKNTPPEKLNDSLAGLSIIVTQLCDTFKEDNPRFKREDFLRSLKG